MPGDKGKACTCTVQTTLTGRSEQTRSQKEHIKEKPSKQKRTHSDVAEDSLCENVDIQQIHKELQEIKECVLCSVNKADLDNAMIDVVRTNELKNIVTNIVSDLMLKFKEEYEKCLRERTTHLQEQLDSLHMDHEQLRETIHTQNKKIREMELTIKDNEHKANLALTQANQNEQYDQKCNIKILNKPENTHEDLKQDFINIVKTDMDIDLDVHDISAIHRIPGKRDEPRPVIVKLTSNEVKSKIMKKKRELKNSVRFVDDITKRNASLLWKLRQHELGENAWYFNGRIFVKAKDKRIRFDIFDNIDNRLAQYGIH